MGMPLMLRLAIEDASGRRRDMLTDAVSAFVRMGELREELLPLLWEGTGLHKDDYPAVLQMLCAAGQLYLPRRTLQVSACYGRLRHVTAGCGRLRQVLACHRVSRPGTVGMACNDM